MAFRSEHTGRDCGGPEELTEFVCFLSTVTPEVILNGEDVGPVSGRMDCAWKTGTWSSQFGLGWLAVSPQDPPVLTLEASNTKIVKTMAHPYAFKS